MPDWLWILALFIGMTAAYFAGWYAGSWRNADDCPSENAWIKAIELQMDMEREVRQHDADNELKKWFAIMDEYGDRIKDKDGDD